VLLFAPSSHSCCLRWLIAPVLLVLCELAAARQSQHASHHVLTARIRYKLVQSESTQQQSDSNAQQGVLIASLIFWSCCAIAAASLAHRTRQSYLALIRQTSQATTCNWACAQLWLLTPRHQVHPNQEASTIDAESRIVSAAAYGRVPMSHASVPIGTAALMRAVTANVA
jgi:hypothetical protein